MAPQTDKLNTLLTPFFVHKSCFYPHSLVQISGVPRLPPTDRHYSPHSKKISLLCPKPFSFISHCQRVTFFPHSAPRLLHPPVHCDKDMLNIPWFPGVIAQIPPTLIPKLPSHRALHTSRPSDTSPFSVLFHLTSLSVQSCPRDSPSTE